MFYILSNFIIQRFPVKFEIQQYFEQISFDFYTVMFWFLTVLFPVKFLKFNCFFIKFRIATDFLFCQVWISNRFSVKYDFQLFSLLPNDVLLRFLSNLVFKFALNTIIEIKFDNRKLYSGSCRNWPLIRWWRKTQISAKLILTCQWSDQQLIMVNSRMGPNEQLLPDVNIVSTILNLKFTKLDTLYGL